MATEKKQVNERQSIQLKEKILIQGVITADSGLHIGGTNTSMQIGGVDNAVIRNPVTDEPYIPGSSLKGKMRSLLELSYGKNYIQFTNMGNVKFVSSDDINLITAQLFGTAKNDGNQRPSRIIVRDAILKNASALKGTELNLTEIKTEVVIDRITSAAVPRQLERVPAGAEFKLDIVLNIFEEIDSSNKPYSRKDFIINTFRALELLQDDYIGGSGSRGSGKISINIDKVLVKTAAYYRGDEDGSNAEEEGDKILAEYCPESIRS
ncbi:MAG: type III-A CRISPR-associated RAMP protein Csm3 [Bernardetiaceae bacterium]|nr:type III-A CRISPR-associated RAMP protein Csm3 [Bernardetiaceae bacterium]